MGDIRLDGLARAALEAIRNMNEISAQGVNDLKASSPSEQMATSQRKSPALVPKSICILQRLTNQQAKLEVISI